MIKGKQSDAYFCDKFMLQVYWLNAPNFSKTFQFLKIVF